MKEQIKPELNLEQQRSLALQKADLEYYDRTSPHHADNDRYQWAIRSINHTYNELLKGVNTNG